MHHSFVSSSRQSSKKKFYCKRNYLRKNHAWVLLQGEIEEPVAYSNTCIFYFPASSMSQQYRTPNWFEVTIMWDTLRTNAVPMMSPSLMLTMLPGSWSPLTNLSFRRTLQSTKLAIRDGIIRKKSFSSRSSLNWSFYMQPRRKVPKTNQCKSNCGNNAKEKFSL